VGLNLDMGISWSPALTAYLLFSVFSYGILSLLIMKSNNQYDFEDYYEDEYESSSEDQVNDIIQEILMAKKQVEKSQPAKKRRRRTRRKN
ncbi:hypothetical protein, partial [Enterobacter hormaechei]|uniref:hypothetical protein n=1 Tax=Enterobacter hormaechei TaxID=158836 RepID=UPI00200D0BAE